MAKKIDLTGQQFGKLTVLRYVGTDGSGAVWECQCECGNITTARGTALRQGKRVSCGCQRKEKLLKENQTHIKDLTGQRFGKLTVINMTNKRQEKSVVWHCICDCGNETDVPARDLISGNTKSCGCMRSKSYGEEKIKTILLTNHIDFVQEYNVPSCNLYRFDFYLKQYNTIIEYDGIQHFQMGTGQFDNPDKFKLTQERDKNKNQWCKDNHINLIRIPYTHYKDLCLEDLLPETSKFLL